MPSYTTNSYLQYASTGGTTFEQFGPAFPASATIEYLTSGGDEQFDKTDTATTNTTNDAYAGDDFLGYTIYKGNTFLLFYESQSGNYYMETPTANLTDEADWPPSVDTSTMLDNLAFCFAAGTGIATPDGEIAVEALNIGDPVLTEDGKTTPVKWIGRQTMVPMFSGAHAQPVRIRAGALGDGVPSADLTVTADHGMIIDGLVINASALVNGTTIDWVPMSELPGTVVYYHIETENHDVILANGAPAETFVDVVSRAKFDNHAEYLSLYGVERIVPEMDRPRISSRRLLPDAIKARLGIKPEVIDFRQPLSA